MVAIKTLLALLPLALAAPVEVEVRQSGASTCGDNYYSASKLRSAANAASNYVQQGTTAGGSTYPHKYNNYEGFDFPDNGPYYEFPLKESGVYSGGSPGADRVIVNGDGDYEGSITHTGASGNNFVACSDTN